MIMITKRAIFLICLILFAGAVVSAQFKYIGAEKCKMCHNKPATGDQYAKWSKDPHANAFKSLSSQKSLDYAKKNGIADPSKEAKCLKCHTTFDAVAANLRSGITQAEGVSCETCHGPGSTYKSPSIMKNLAAAKQNGLIVPNQALCMTCHGNSKDNPFFKEFNYATYSAKVAHPNPEAKK
jgi:hypothetical protein